MHVSFRIRQLTLAATLAFSLTTITPTPAVADGGAVAAAVGAAFAGLIIGSATEHQLHATHPVYAYPTVVQPVASAAMAPVTLARVAPVTVSYTVPTVLYAAPVVHAAPASVIYIPVASR
ncbi:MAG: hypothetical protein G8237_08470 [Magnetococcales bacterium]|nr:hypothetical protein [Magnetococcales bacterium]NGZ06376.1 hypothetical protein [Magnetococcales bacterium]